MLLFDPRELWADADHSSIAVNVLTSITGVNVIQYFQTRLYRDLGMTGNTVLALAAAWGTTGFLSNAVSLRYLADRFGRRP
jgi:MFS family permease